MENFKPTEYDIKIKPYEEILVPEDRINAYIQFHERRKLVYEEFLSFYPNEPENSKPLMEVKDAILEIDNIIQTLKLRLQPKTDEI